ncbi:MAG: (d)CMP kinase [Flavobacteriaceae bacterium]|nr:(d)CMP kinase [Flavobacteriaceae bacterium]
MQKIIIAIDGYSSTGKSTIAKQLAQTLEYIYVDSGAMYRAVTLYALQNGFIKDDEFQIDEFVHDLHKVHLKFEFNPDLGYSEIVLNGVNVEKDIRTLEVSNFVSQVSAIPEVRYQLVKIQRKLGEDRGVVMDGRDIGTVVFPDAELKIFMNASPEIKAKRRYDELIARGDEVNFEEVLRNVRERDYIDSHRKDSPLIKAEDAIEIDNSDLTLEEQFDKIMGLVKMTLEDYE